MPVKTPVLTPPRRVISNNNVPTGKLRERLDTAAEDFKINIPPIDPDNPTMSGDTANILINTIEKAIASLDPIAAFDNSMRSTQEAFDAIEAKHQEAQAVRRGKFEAILADFKEIRDGSLENLHLPLTEDERRGFAAWQREVDNIYMELTPSEINAMKSFISLLLRVFG